MSQKTIHNIFRWLILGIFFCAIFGPATQMILVERKPFSFTEKRVLATFPQTPETSRQMTEFTSGLDSYINDHFGFREWYIYRYQREVRKYFNTIKKIKVYIGLDDWYYYTGAKNLLDYAGRYPLSDADLSFWLESYREKKNWLKSKGIQYLLVTPPNKQTVYPEFVMSSWREVQGKTRLHQLKEVLTENDNATFIDLSPVLISQKGNDLLYYKSDTHWTQYGAYLGYKTLVEKLATMLPGSGFKKDFTFSEVTDTCNKEIDICGDLTSMLLDFKPFEESYKVVTNFSPCATELPFNYVLDGINTRKNAPSFTRGCQEKKLKAVVFRDSFLNTMEPFLSENFAEIIYLWKKYDQDNMEKILEVFQPDIIIEETVERSLFIN